MEIGKSRGESANYQRIETLSMCSPSPMTSFKFFVVEPHAWTKIFRAHRPNITLSRHEAFLEAVPHVVTTAWLEAYGESFGEEITSDDLRHPKQQQ